MKTIKTLLILVAGILLFTRCSDFGDVNRDPNKPSIPATRSLFVYAAFYVPNFGYMGNYDPWNQLYPNYLTERTNVQYTKFMLTPFATSSYYRYAIRGLDDIIAYNQNPATAKESWVSAFGDANNQIGVAQTLRAFFYMHMTDVLGMLPYSEANYGPEGNYTPKYDTQEYIYTDLDKKLTEVYALLDEDGRMDNTYETLYNGDISKWKKLNASIRMMMAIKLSDVAPAVGKERFAKAYADGGIIDNVDLFEYKYLPENDNANPLWINMVQKPRKDFVPTGQLISQLKAFNDPRMQAYAVPNQAGEYVGIPFGTLAEDISTKWEDGSFCDFNPKYYQQDAPQVMTTPSHILLLQAEAAVRGWIAADPEVLYKAGIKASFDQHKETDGYDFDAYYNQDGVKLTGSNEEKIAKIGMQRWLANYMQDGIEAWSDWRRLGVPSFITPGDAGATYGGVTHIPFRRCYSTTDYTPNQANHDAAIAAQGADSFDTRVWWDVK